MKNDRRKSNRKSIIIGSLAVLLIVIAVAVTYKIVLTKPAGEAGGGIYADNRDNIKPIEVVTPTPVEDKPIYVMDVDEVLNSQPVVTTVTPVPDEAAEQKADVPEKIEDQDVVVDDPDKPANQDEEVAKPVQKEEKKVVVDESPKTIKEKNVKEYKGGEKAGSGNSFMDLIPDNDPADDNKAENGDVDASGIEVGTWN